MSTTIDRNEQNEQEEYFKLVTIHPLLAIHSDEELAAAVRMAEGLLDRCTLSDGARNYLETLTTLIESYEEELEPVGDASDAAVLAHLIEAKGVKQKEVARATGIVESTISDVLHGRRKFNREQVGFIARYFRVPVTVFSFDE